jgi:hypothetical protein
MIKLQEKVSDRPVEPTSEQLNQTQSEAGEQTRPISAWEEVLYLTLFMALVAVRIPNILNGRFWAEEGTVFFLNAWHMPWYQALFVSYGGYLNITANGFSVLAAHIAPLEKACYVTSICGLLVQTIPAILLTLSPDNWLKNRLTLIAALLIIATLPVSQEVWLSTIGSQCHLNLCAALIVVLGVRLDWVRHFNRVVLLLGPLSGPGAAFMVPLYFARAWFDRSRERLIQGLILSAATATQLLFFWHPQERSMGLDPVLLLSSWFLKHFICPMFGFQESLEITRLWRDKFMEGHIPSVPGLIAAVLMLGVFAYIAFRSKEKAPKWFFMAAFLLWGLSSYGCLGDKTMLLIAGANERYAFAPQVLWELALLCLSVTSAAGWIKTICRYLIVWLLVIAAHEYFWTPAFYGEGPSWRSEVRRWRADPHYVPRAWPVPGWEMHL